MPNTCRARGAARVHNSLYVWYTVRTALIYILALYIYRYASHGNFLYAAHTFDLYQTYTSAHSDRAVYAYLHLELAHVHDPNMWAVRTYIQILHMSCRAAP